MLLINLYCEYYYPNLNRDVHLKLENKSVSIFLVMLKGLS